MPIVSYQRPIYVYVCMYKNVTLVGRAYSFVIQYNNADCVHVMLTVDDCIRWNSRGGLKLEASKLCLDFY